MEAPTDFLPILVGDYLAAHFAIYGLLTALGLMIVRRNPQADSAPRVSLAMFAASSAAVALFGTLVFGIAIDMFVASFVPTLSRLPLILAKLAGTLPYFAAD